MKNLNEALVLASNSRYRTKLYLEYQGFDVSDTYEFDAVINGELHHARILHFGLIQMEDNDIPETLVDFLEGFVQQKRQTIVNNIGKCFGLKAGGYHGEV